MVSLPVMCGERCRLGADKTGLGSLWRPPKQTSRALKQSSSEYADVAHRLEAVGYCNSLGGDCPCRLIHDLSLHRSDTTTSLRDRGRDGRVGVRQLRQAIRWNTCTGWCRAGGPQRSWCGGES